MKINKLKKINLGVNSKEVKLLGCMCVCVCTPMDDPQATAGSQLGTSMGLTQALKK